MKIKIGFLSVMLFLSLIISHSSFALATCLAILIHESGHIISARLLRIRFSECKISIFGARLRPETAFFSYRDEITICAWGPLINYFSCVIAFPVYIITKSTFVLYFICASFTLATLNLLPVKDFDGGRILYSLFSLFLSPIAVDNILSITSFIIVFALWCISVYLIIIANSSLSLFIFSLSLFSKIFLSKLNP